MPVLHAPSPHTAERNRAARRMQWLGLVPFAYIATRLAYIMPEQIYRPRPEGMESLILSLSTTGIVLLLFIAVGMSLMAAARGIHCGMRWAYTLASVLSAAIAMTSTMFVLNLIRAVARSIEMVGFDRAVEAYFDGSRFLLFWHPLIFHLIGALLAALVFYAVARLYWIERRAKTSAAR